MLVVPRVRVRTLIAADVLLAAMYEDVSEGASAYLPKDFQLVSEAMVNSHADAIERRGIRDRFVIEGQSVIQSVSPPFGNGKAFKKGCNAAGAFWRKDASGTET